MRILLILLTLFFSGIAFSDSTIGAIKSMRNNVFVVRNFETMDVSKGFRLLSKDIIITGDKSKAKLRFDDKTLITVGKNSIFEIEDYMFDKTKKSKAKFKAKYGFFSAVTGKIGKLAPDSFKLKTKTATIGVRGTAFEGKINKDGEDVACTKGTISVSAKGKTFILNEGESLEITEEMFEPDVEIVGEIVSVSGTVFLINGSQTFIATKGYQIGLKDQVITSYNSTAEIKLIDNTQVSLLKNSGCRLDYKDGAGKIDILKGTIKFNNQYGYRIASQGETVVIKSGKF